MKNKILLRGLLGIILGVFIGHLISIVCSLIFANGYYAAAVPQLIDNMGSEIGAVILQSVLCGVLGAVFAGASVIWDIEAWNLLRQTMMYFAITAFANLPIAYVLYWMEHSVAGFFSYFVIYIGIFVFIWITQYFSLRNKITRINQSLNNPEE